MCVAVHRHLEAACLSANACSRNVMLACSFLRPTASVVLPIPINYLQGFGVGTAAVGMTISTYALARLMMNLPAGILADRHGRKLLLVWGPAVTALGRHLHSICCLLKLLELLHACVCECMQVGGVGACLHHLTAS